MRSVKLTRAMKSSPALFGSESGNVVRIRLLNGCSSCEGHLELSRSAVAAAAEVPPPLLLKTPHSSRHSHTFKLPGQVPNSAARYRSRNRRLPKVLKGALTVFPLTSKFTTTHHASQGKGRAAQGEEGRRRQDLRYEEQEGWCRSEGYQADSRHHCIRWYTR